MVDDPIDMSHSHRMKMPGNLEKVKVSEKMATKMGIAVFKAEALPGMTGKVFQNFLNEVAPSKIRASVSPRPMREM